MPVNLNQVACVMETSVRTDLTDITVVLDRSGSMASIQEDMEGGLNTYIKDQQQQPGEANFTLVQFDDQYDRVHVGIPINTVPKCKLQPRGYTALYDAVGRAVTETGERLDKLPDGQKPGTVIMVIVTDGHENASKEYTAEQVRDLVTRQSTIYNWRFTYLGANQDAFAVAKDMGVQSSANYAAVNSKSMWNAASGLTTRSRTGGPSDYTAVELSAMVSQ